VRCLACACRLRSCRQSPPRTLPRKSRSKAQMSLGNSHNAHAANVSEPTTLKRRIYLDKCWTFPHSAMDEVSLAQHALVPPRSFQIFRFIQQYISILPPSFTVARPKDHLPDLASLWTTNDERITPAFEFYSCNPQETGTKLQRQRCISSCENIQQYNADLEWDR
jgi:hypothetical protein